MKGKIILSIIIGTFLIGLVQATTTTLDAYPNELKLKPGDSSQIFISYSIDNTNGLGGAKGVSLNGNPQFISYSGGSINFGTNTTTTGILTLQVNVPSDASNGDVTNTVTVDGVNKNILFHIEGEEPTTGCRLIELPHTTSFKIKQGETGASGEIKVKASSECADLDFNVIEQTQMSKPMFIQSKGESIPGEEYSFTIGLDATDVSVGNYNNVYTISASSGDNVYQKSISLSTTVTLGDSPISNNTFSDLPTCNLETELKLNSSYIFSCSNENPNLAMEVLYNDFFKGISVSEDGSNFKYKFQPLKMGNTDFVCLFKYKGVPIGDPFVKEVRITKSGSAVSGTELKVLFYQSSVKKEIDKLSTGNVNLLIKDESTDSVVEEFTLYLNGDKINNSFYIEADKFYELIVDSPTYSSRTLNFTVSESELDVKIIPDQTYYYNGDQIEFNTSINDTVYLFDNEKITNPFILNKIGNFTIKVVKENYKDKIFNLTIRERITWRSYEPNPVQDWKKGKDVIIRLSKNSSWEVKKDDTITQTGNSDLVEFEISDYGKWGVYAEGNYVIGHDLVKKSWTKDLWNWIKEHWIISTVIILVIILGGGWYLFFRESGENDEYGGEDEYG